MKSTIFNSDKKRLLLVLILISPCCILPQRLDTTDSTDDDLLVTGASNTSRWTTNGIMMSSNSTNNSVLSLPVNMTTASNPAFPFNGTFGLNSTSRPSTLDAGTNSSTTTQRRLANESNPTISSNTTLTMIFNSTRVPVETNGPFWNLSEILGNRTTSTINTVFSNFSLVANMTTFNASQLMNMSTDLPTDRNASLMITNAPLVSNTMGILGNATRFNGSVPGSTNDTAVSNTSMPINTTTATTISSLTTTITRNLTATNSTAPPSSLNTTRSSVDISSNLNITLPASGSFISNTTLSNLVPTMNVTMDTPSNRNGSITVNNSSFVSTSMPANSNVTQSNTSMINSSSTIASNTSFLINTTRTINIAPFTTVTTRNLTINESSTLASILNTTRVVSDLGSNVTTTSNLAGNRITSTTSTDNATLGILNTTITLRLNVTQVSTPATGNGTVASNISISINLTTSKTPGSNESTSQVPGINVVNVTSAMVNRTSTMTSTVTTNVALIGNSTAVMLNMTFSNNLNVTQQTTVSRNNSAELNTPMATRPTLTNVTVELPTNRNISFLVTNPSTNASPTSNGSSVTDSAGNRSVTIGSTGGISFSAVNTTSSSVTTTQTLPKSSGITENRTGATVNPGLVSFTSKTSTASSITSAQFTVSNTGNTTVATIPIINNTSTESPVNRNASIPGTSSNTTNLLVTQLPMINATRGNLSSNLTMTSLLPTLLQQTTSLPTGNLSNQNISASQQLPTSSPSSQGMINTNPMTSTSLTSKSNVTASLTNLSSITSAPSTISNTSGINTTGGLALTFSATLRPQTDSILFTTLIPRLNVTSQDITSSSKNTLTTPNFITMLGNISANLFSSLPPPSLSNQMTGSSKPELSRTMEPMISTQDLSRTARTETMNTPRITTAMPMLSNQTVTRPDTINMNRSGETIQFNQTLPTGFNVTTTNQPLNNITAATASVTASFTRPPSSSSSITPSTTVQTAGFLQITTESQVFRNQTGGTSLNTTQDSVLLTSSSTRLTATATRTTSGSSSTANNPITVPITIVNASQSTQKPSLLLNSSVTLATVTSDSSRSVPMFNTTAQTNTTGLSLVSNQTVAGRLNTTDASISITAQTSPSPVPTNQASGTTVPSINITAFVSPSSSASRTNQPGTVTWLPVGPSRGPNLTSLTDATQSLLPSFTRGPVTGPLFTPQQTDDTTQRSSMVSASANRTLPTILNMTQLATSLNPTTDDGDITSTRPLFPSTPGTSNIRVTTLNPSVSLNQTLLGSVSPSFTTTSSLPSASITVQSTRPFLNVSIQNTTVAPLLTPSLVQTLMTTPSLLNSSNQTGTLSVSVTMPMGSQTSSSRGTQSSTISPTNRLATAANTATDDDPDTTRMLPSTSMFLTRLVSSTMARNSGMPITDDGITTNDPTSPALANVVTPQRTVTTQPVHASTRGIILTSLLTQINTRETSTITTVPNASTSSTLTPGRTVPEAVMNTTIHSQAESTRLNVAFTAANISTASNATSILLTTLSMNTNSSLTNGTTLSTTSQTLAANTTSLSATNTTTPVFRTTANPILIPSTVAAVLQESTGPPPLNSTTRGTTILSSLLATSSTLLTDRITSMRPTNSTLPSTTSPLRNSSALPGSNECVFPFLYLGLWYDKCVSDILNDSWCSLTENFDRDRQWKYCRAPRIKTYGGTGNGGDCVFPFVYQGASFSTCIYRTETIGTMRSFVLFCGTTSNLDQHGLWGYCLDYDSCHFPFIYNGVTYSDCISGSNSPRWCSTTSNFDRNKMWTNCPVTCDGYPQQDENSVGFRLLSEQRPCVFKSVIAQDTGLILKHYTLPTCQLEPLCRPNYAPLFRQITCQEDGRYSQPRAICLPTR